MADIGRSLVLIGLLLTLVGGVVWCLGRWGFRGLPGDIRYEGQHLRVYVPIVTCLVLSALLTGLMWLWRWLNRR